MLEDYMLDMGYMGDLIDEARFIGKRDISRIGARVAIDLFFMTGDRKYLDVGIDCDITSDDPFVAAGNLLQAVTGFVPERVQNELNWYSQARGYPLSYLVGNRLVWGLKKDVKDNRTKTGVEEIDIDRELHSVYQESGNMPVSYQRRVYEHQGINARAQERQTRDQPALAIGSSTAAPVPGQPGTEPRDRPARAARRTPAQ
jgi:hypothetical protein